MTHKIRFASLLFFFSISTLVHGQVCTPNPAFTGEGIYPNTSMGIAEACVNTPYSQTFTIRVTPDTIIAGFLFTVNYLRIDAVNGLPAGFSYACEPSNCTFNGGTTGCAIVTGTPGSAQAGNYPISIATTFQVYNVTFGTVTQTYTYTGYNLIVNALPQPNITPAGPVVAICTPGTTALDAGAGYTAYQWYQGAPLPGANGQTYAPTVASDYTVMVTDTDGCVGADTVSVIFPTTVITTGSQDAACGVSDGQAWASASGWSPFSYSWNTVPVQANDTATGLGAGTYIVYTTDSLGCLDSATVNISNAGGPILDSLNFTDVLCNGDSNGSAEVFHSGGTPGFTYLWSNGGTGTSVSGLGAGNYSVTVTDSNSCQLVGSVTISEPPAITLFVSGTDETCPGCNDGTVSTTTGGGTGSFTFLWSNSATTASLTGLAGGTYCVTITDANGCTASACDTLQTLVSISGPGYPSGVRVFPNPSAGEFFIELSDDLHPVSIELYDAFGKMVQTLDRNKSGQSVSLSGFPSGIYFLRVQLPDKGLVKRVVIE